MLEAILQTALGFWNVLGQMAPYLLFGFFVAGLLSVVISPEWIERHLGGRGVWPVLKASAFGVPLPLCSCGVIPVAAGLKKHGASRAATTAFLLSTPQTGVDSILVTYGLLGPVYAIFRPLAALITGLFGGTAVAISEENGPAAQAAAEPCKDACCAKTGKRNWLAQTLHYGFVTLAGDIVKPLLIGLLIAGVISAVVPKDFFADKLGTGLSGILVMMALGIPIYVCATASVPIAAALIVMGVSPGAALAFLITGPATNAATLSIIWKVLGKRTALIYLTTVAVSAVGMGLLLNHFYAVADVPVVAAHTLHDHGATPLQTVSAIALLGVLGYALFSDHSKEKSVIIDDHGQERIALTVTGMTCQHCVRNVERALLESKGATAAQVDLKTGHVEVTGNQLNTELLAQAVRELGYGVSDPES